MAPVTKLDMSSEPSWPGAYMPTPGVYCPPVPNFMFGPAEMIWKLWELMNFEGDSLNTDTPL